MYRSMQVLRPEIASSEKPSDAFVWPLNIMRGHTWQRMRSMSRRLANGNPNATTTARW